MAAGAGAPPGSGAAEQPVPERETRPSAPATDALNLWVLSRPTGDLRSTTEPAPAYAEPAQARGPAPAVLVLLGVGPGQTCAKHLAQHAVDALSSRAPQEVLASTLDAARSWRWPQASGSASATMKSSAGAFGGVQSAPASLLTTALLLQSLERGAVLGGPRAAWPAAGAAGPAPAPCSEAPDPGLAGPIGVLARTDDGTFLGGVLGMEPPADAGVVSIAAQYGVALAVGEAGAVLMSGDCEPPLLERSAERVYASPSWLVATADVQTPSNCRLGHALLTRERAWVASGDVLAWALAEALPAQPAPAAPPPAPPLTTPPLPAASDAGSAPPAVQP